MATGDDDVPDLVSDNDSENDDEDHWEDLNEDHHWGDEGEDDTHHLEGSVSCLFCELEEKSVDALLEHCTKQHDFNLVQTCKTSDIDCVSYIKMINFIRKDKPSPAEVKKAATTGQLWVSDDFMVAVDPEDLLLQFDIESSIEQHTSSDNEDSAGTGDVTDFTESEAVVALIQRTQRAEEQRDLLKEELNRALQDIARLRTTGQQLMIGGNDKPEKKPSHLSSLHEEDGYFASYSHHGIHQTMLMDKVRTESYRDFMYENPHLFEGKTVLDVGCGTGILSMFAAKAGAKKVVAVDQSNIIYQAMDIARENKLHEKITFVKGRLEDVNLPVEKFDIIISEWMGYFLLFEAMLDSVLWARDHCLAPGGCVYPDDFSILLVGIDDPKLRSNSLEYWDDVYGFKMSCMKTSVVEEVHVKRLTGEVIATEPAVVKEIKVMECSVKDLDFSSEFCLQCQRDCNITAIVGYFDTFFNQGCQKKISFSTGPQATPTHWDQAVMLLPKPITVTKGSSLQGSITYRKHPNDTRGVIITLSVDKQKMKYSLS